MDVSKAQKINKILLYEFDKYCEKHNIKYRVEGGTLIGAVRHKGFIPWDDDCDVTMKKEEYDKFVECIKKDPMGDEFLFMSPQDLADKTGHFHDFISRIFYLKEVFRDGKKYEDRFNGYFKYLWLDILILYEVNDINIFKKKFYFGLAAGHRYYTNFKDRTLFEKVGIKTLSFIGRFIDLKFIINKYLEKDKVKNPKYYYYINFPLIYIHYKLKKEWEDEYIKVPFEDIEVYISKHYDEELNALDYNYKELPKEEERVPSHFEVDI